MQRFIAACACRRNRIALLCADILYAGCRFDAQIFDRFRSDPDFAGGAACLQRFRVALLLNRDITGGRVNPEIDGGAAAELQVAGGDFCLKVLCRNICKGGIGGGAAAIQCLQLQPSGSLTSSIFFAFVSLKLTPGLQYRMCRVEPSSQVCICCALSSSTLQVSVTVMPD